MTSRGRRAGSEELCLIVVTTFSAASTTSRQATQEAMAGEVGFTDGLGSYDWRSCYLVFEIDDRLLQICYYGSKHSPHFVRSSFCEH